MIWGNQKQKYDIYSSTKSIGVTALGLAIMDGKVNLHDKAKKHFPSVGIPPESNEQSSWLDELTLWHLATQTGGFEKTRGWCRQINRPGTAWMYSDGGPNWLADCLTSSYGRDLQEVMNERVFKLLGITIGGAPRGGEHDLHWGFNNLDRPHELDGINRRPFGAGIHCNVQAMAKIGYLYLRRGCWGGRQIIPESFVGLATSQAEGIEKLPVKDGLLWSGRASAHYGLLWWNNSDGAIEGVPRDAYWSWGLKESFIMVVPSLDIVAVRAGDYWAPRNDPKRKDSFNNIVKPFLLPICESVEYQGPCPQSTHIPRITFSDLILH
jgi:CubicO group peptidase (beta-lactamase class C family)